MEVETEYGYEDTAREHEAVFRAILADINEGRLQLRERTVTDYGAFSRNSGAQKALAEYDPEADVLRVLSRRTVVETFRMHESLDDLLAEVSGGASMLDGGTRADRLTVFDFRMDRPGRFEIDVGRVSGVLSGSGVTLVYAADGERIRYSGIESTWRS